MSDAKYKDIGITLNLKEELVIYQDVKQALGFSVHILDEVHSFLNLGICIVAFFSYCALPSNLFGPQLKAQFGSTQ